MQEGCEATVHYKPTILEVIKKRLKKNPEQTNKREKSQVGWWHPPLKERRNVKTGRNCGRQWRIQFTPRQLNHQYENQRSLLENT